MTIPYSLQSCNLLNLQTSFAFPWIKKLFNLYLIYTIKIHSNFSIFFFNICAFQFLCPFQSGLLDCNFEFISKIYCGPWKDFYSLPGLWATLHIMNIGGRQSKYSQKIDPSKLCGCSYHTFSCARQDQAHITVPSKYHIFVTDVLHK